MKDTLPPRLKLKAETPEDIEVLSALLQDALVPSLGLVHDLKTGDFCMLLYRYEQAYASSSPQESHRFQSYLHIPHILHVQRRSIDGSDPSEHLVLLTLSHEDDAFVFTFAGDKALRVITTQRGLFLTDTQIGWPTIFTPTHEES